ncbi:MAG: Gfo/Idh/MocA family oxidoreductase [Planctomycetes bacterium]|nr:Gfo/Idh/MocA family oxidoreductase [Planctomycetota bacterium]
MSLRIGILGCGGMAGAHAERLNDLGSDVEVVALCDVSTEITEAFVERCFKDSAHTPTHYTDAAKMYAEAKLDGVIIISPHTLHYDHACQALDADVHILLEKPMVTNVQDAYALRDKVEASGKTMIIGYNTPCTPILQFMKKVIADKRFGKLEMVNGYLSQNWMKATTGTWRQKPELSGGGQAYDSGAHLLCSLVWSVASSPKTVSAFTENFDCDVDINSVINIRFDNEVLASIAVSGNCISGGADMVFLFEGARIVIDPWGGERIQAWDKDGEVDITGDVTGAYVNPTKHFIEVLQGKSEPSTTPENGVHQSELMDAIYESAKIGRAVTLSELVAQ